MFADYYKIFEHLLLEPTNVNFRLHNHNEYEILLFLEGKDIDMLTSRSESAVIAMQKSVIKKLKFMSYILSNWFLEECLEDEFYIANLAVKPEYRKHGYSKIMIKAAKKIAKQREYKKLSLLANNDRLVNFYETVGFELENKKTRRMVANIT